MHLTLKNKKRRKNKKKKAQVFVSLNLLMRFTNGSQSTIVIYEVMIWSKKKKINHLNPNYPLILIELGLTQSQVE